MPKPEFRNQPAAREHDLVASLRAAGNFTKLLVILDRAGMTATLSDSTKGFTLFAPDDAAFAQLPAALVAKLTADPAQARAFILPYILSGRLTGGDLTRAASNLGLHDARRQAAQLAGRDSAQTAPRGGLRTFAGTPLQVSNRPDGGAGLTARSDAGLLVIFDAAASAGGTNGWPCCGRVTSADHVMANGVYHVITFTGADGGARR